jgi:hypothetical protein
MLRGLNENHNHDLKAIFKSAATRASCCAGPFQDFYQALLAKGMEGDFSGHNPRESGTPCE